MKKDFQSIHKRALKAAENYLRSESDLIEILQEVDECKGYRELELKNLFEYGVQALKLSRAVTFNLIAVARKAKEVPQLQDRIRSREITMSNARTIAPVLTPQNQEQWLHAAATLSKHKLEKKIAAENPKLAVPERVSYVAAERLEFKIGISEELHQKILRAQDLVSSRLKRAASLEDTLKILAEFYLEKEDPIRKAERAKARASDAGESCVGASNVADSRTAESKAGESKSRVGKKLKDSGTFNTEPKSGSAQEIRPARSMPSLRDPERYIPADLEHQVNLRDQGQCTHCYPNGMRCQERRWLDIHHVVPLSQGGKTALDNLTTLCRGHHQLIHALNSSAPGQVESKRSRKFSLGEIGPGQFQYPMLARAPRC